MNWSLDNDLDIWNVSEVTANHMQSLANKLKEAREITIKMQDKWTNSDIRKVEPVSYTHLDVYKRQD